MKTIRAVGVWGADAGHVENPLALFLDGSQFVEMREAAGDGDEQVANSHCLSRSHESCGTVESRKSRAATGEFGDRQDRVEHMDDALGFAGTSEFEINPDAVTKIVDLLFKLGPAEREGGAVKPRALAPSEISD